MNFDKTDLKEGTLIIQNEDGSTTCIPEQDCTEKEKVLFYEFRKKYSNGKSIMFSIEDTKIQKINEMNLICQDKIINEFYSTCLGEKKRFDCTLVDQSNIMGLVAKAQMISANLTTDTTLDWKASGEPSYYPWTTTQITTLVTDLFTHKTENIKRFEQLRIYINSLTTVNEVNKVMWDIVIPS